tara:strand:- start:1401 stop:2363 length:963 start_codon:yes stop_codon:yes gene_type:complete
LFKSVIKTFFICIWVLPAYFSYGEEVVFGTLEIENFQSDILGERRLLFYQPNSLEINQNTSFIIVQDGQYLFDAEVNWVKQEWGVDETFKSLSERDGALNIVIIGVDNAAAFNGGKMIDETKRYAEYFPKQTIDYLNRGFRKFAYRNFVEVKKFNYLEFLEKELIPHIENKFNTNLNSDNLGIMGASMGGLISLNALIELPDKFGFAGSFSTHWIGIRPLDYFLFPFRKEIKFLGDPYVTEAIYSYILENIDVLKDKKIYLDRGTESLDKFYAEPHKNIEELFSANSIFYKGRIFEGLGHTPEDFGKRFEVALNFLIEVR